MMASRERILTSLSKLLQFPPLSTFYLSKCLLHLQHFVIYFPNKLQQKVEEEEEFWQNDVIGKTFTSHEKEREAILINGFSSFFLLNIT